MRLAAVLCLVAMTAGCGLVSEADYYQYRTVTYFAWVVGPHDTFTVWYTDDSDADFREEEPDSAVWQVTVKDSFYEVTGLELHVQADVEPQQGNSPIPILPPTVSCGIAVDGKMYRQSAHGYATNCRVDFDDVTTPPQAAPDESVDSGSSSGGTIVWLGALLGAAVLVARWAYVRWRRSEARAAPDSPRTPGYERRPQFHFMLLCGLIALLAFALVFALSVFLQPRSAARTPIPGVTSVPPGLTEPQPPPRPTLPTGMPTIVEPTG